MAEIGGYDLDFIETPPEDYECPICHLVMKEPQIVDCCGYKYCLTCVDRISFAGRGCPMCQEPNFKNMPEKQLQRKIFDLKVNCIERKQGCNWEGEIRHLSNHLQQVCLYVNVSCPLKCGQIYQRCKLQQHQDDDCIQRTPEIKLTSLVNKLVVRLVAVETKCNLQDEKIDALTRELEEVKGMQVKEIEHLEGELNTLSKYQQSQTTQALREVEGELIRRCISFPLRVTITNSWISPPFSSHPKGYLLQLKSELKKFGSSVDSLTYSLFSSGRSPDKSPIILSLDILPQLNDEDKLDWPVHVTVDILVLSTMDDNSNGKMYTLTKYMSVRSSDQYDDDVDETNKSTIGHSRFCFSCRLLVLNICYGPDPPLLEQDTRIAVNDGKP